MSLPTWCGVMRSLEWIWVPLEDSSEQLMELRQLLGHALGEVVSASFSHLVCSRL